MEGKREGGKKEEGWGWIASLPLIYEFEQLWEVVKDRDHEASPWGLERVDMTRTEQQHIHTEGRPRYKEKKYLQVKENGLEEANLANTLS